MLTYDLFIIDETLLDSTVAFSKVINSIEQKKACPMLNGFFCYINGFCIAWYGEAIVMTLFIHRLGGSERICPTQRYKKYNGFIEFS